MPMAHAGPRDGSPEHSTGSSAVLLPCEPEQFAEFIAGLLGRPQTIERSIPGRFQVQKKDIQNLYHLVDQRVSSQNDATLVQFTVRVVYDDNSSVLLNSFSDFTVYNEVRPLVSRSVHLSWTYLIKFRNKPYPEKQQIDISFVTGHPDFTFDVIVSEVFVPLRPWRGRGIWLRISHTDRTWGTDIEALLTGQIQTLLVEDTPLRRFLRKYSGTVGTIFGVLLFGALLVVAVYTIAFFREQELALARTFAFQRPVTLDQLADLSNILLQLTISNPSNKYLGAISVFTILSLIFSIVSGVVVASFAAKEKPSFVVLSNKAKEYRDRELAHDANSWLSFCLSVCGAIVISIIGNYAFYLLVKHYLQ
jgi:hypothetical protein